MVVDLLVEGVIDETAARKIVLACGHQPGQVFGKQGWQYIRDKLAGFNVRVRYGNPLLVMIDFMDTGLSCPPEIRQWLPDASPRLLLRTVVREIESWLLADRQSIAEYLRISPSKIPSHPEQLPNPKQTLVNLARHSRRRRIKTDIVPPPGMSGSVGPGYTSRIQEFIQNYWDVHRAASAAPSLQRCLSRLQDLTEDLITPEHD